MFELWGAPFSEAAVAAMAPVCASCGVVTVSLGGTLGITAAYGIGDSEITRRRIEADLGVLMDYESNCVGLIEASRQKLEWPVDRYATLPPVPSLLLVPSAEKRRSTWGEI